MNTPPVSRESVCSSWRATPTAVRKKKPLTDPVRRYTERFPSPKPHQQATPQQQQRERRPQPVQWGGAEQREVCGSYHAFVERDVVEEGRTCPRAKAGPVNAPEPTIPAASATPVNTQGFTIFSAEGLCKQMWPRSRVRCFVRVNVFSR